MTPAWLRPWIRVQLAVSNNIVVQAYTAFRERPALAASLAAEIDSAIGVRGHG